MSTANVPIHTDQGGALMTVESGGVLNIASGGKLQNDGVDMDLSSGIATSTSATTEELDVLAGVTPGTVAAGKAVVTTTNKHIDALVISDGGLALGSGAGTAIGATAAEINNACDVSGRVQELTSSGAVTAGKQSVELNHATVVVAATIADAANHQGLFVVKDTSATGTAAHTLTLTSGTFDGTNNVATLNALNECLVVYFDSAGNGTIIENVGSVALS